MLLSLNSFPSDLAKANTTKKLQMMLKTGTSNSQTFPGCIVLEEREHLSSIPDRKAMKAMPTASTAINNTPETTRMIVTESTGSPTSLRVS
jgi:hypothetical protein